MRKFMTAVLALVMLLSVAMPAFAAAATSPAELTEDASSVDIPIIYNIVTGDPGTFNEDVKREIDEQNPVYRVVVSWTATPGELEIPMTYAWDAQNAQYIAVMDKDNARGKANPTAHVKVQNYSNATVHYGVDVSIAGPEKYRDKARIDSITWNRTLSGLKWNEEQLDKLKKGEDLGTASAQIHAPNTPATASQIPSAEGDFRFYATNVNSYWSLDAATEQVATITVSFTTVA